MFSTQVLPTNKPSIMTMSEKELIGKLMKIYHNLEPELKQSHPQLLAKHIAGVFQRAEPKFDFQRAEPGGVGGNRLLLFIMLILAVIARTGARRIYTKTGEEVLPLIIRTISQQTSDTPSFSDTPLISDTPSIADTPSEDPKIELINRAIQQLIEDSDDRWLLKDYRGAVSSETIAIYHSKQLKDFRKNFKSVFQDTPDLVKVLSLTQVALDSLRSNMPFLDKLYNGEPVELIINDTIRNLTRKVDVSEEVQRMTFLRVNYTATTRPIFLEQPMILSSEDGKDTFKRTFNRLIKYEMRQTTGGFTFSGGFSLSTSTKNLRTLCACYLAVNSVELGKKVNKDGPKTQQDKESSFAEPKITEKSKTMLTNFLHLEFPVLPPPLVDLLKDIQRGYVADILIEAEQLRSYIDGASDVLLQAFEYKEAERKAAISLAGKKVVNTDPPGLLDGFWEQMTAFAQVVSFTAIGTALGIGVCSAYMGYMLIKIAMGGNIRRIRQRIRRR